MAEGLAVDDFYYAVAVENSVARFGKATRIHKGQSSLIEAAAPVGVAEQGNPGPVGAGKRADTVETVPYRKAVPVAGKEPDSALLEKQMVGSRGKKVAVAPDREQGQSGKGRAQVVKLLLPVSEVDKKIGPALFNEGETVKAVKVPVGIRDNNDSHGSFLRRREPVTGPVPAEFEQTAPILPSGKAEVKRGGNQ